MLLFCPIRRRRLEFFSGLLLAVILTAVGARDPGKKTLIPDIDDEIDYLSSIIAKQQVSNNRPPESATNLQSPSVSTKSQSTSNNASRISTVKPVTHNPLTPPQQSSKSPKGQTKPIIRSLSRDGTLIIMMSICILLGFVALVLATVCWVRMQKASHLAEKADYPAFQKGSSSVGSISAGDKNLAQSAQMYHYQHQKQQMLSMEKPKAEPKVSTVRTSDEETEDGDFTVYECPGLAPTGEMEVKNPLFDDSALQPRSNH